ncbi:hypothetical protein [Chryseobacterium artocarpi]|uniref:hypothetical protein n=1 Tax=Chryseobacterium artocarpi TaxID=1414727 RepID=UPI003F318F1C
MAELLKILMYSGPSVLILLILIFFGKNAIEYFFSETIEIKKKELNQNLENHKMLLDQQNRSFQHSLDTKLNEFNVRFSKLHEERANVIKELYERLVKLHSATVTLTRRIHPIIEDAEKEEKQRLENVNNALNEFNKFYLVNKIYFDKELSDRLDKVAHEYWSKNWDYATILRMFREGQVSGDFYKKMVEDSQKITEAVDKDITKSLEDLENEFRRVLGVI